MIILKIFRDVFDGIWYFLYLIGCLFAFFYVWGIVGDNKRAKINQKLKEKKTYDIESGREAAIAAMETKQVLTVGDDGMANNPGTTLNDAANAGNTTAEMKKEGKEEVPEVMVLNSTDPSGTQNQAVPAAPQVQPVVNQVASPAPAQAQPASEQQQKAEEPLVLNSSTS